MKAAALPHAAVGLLVLLLAHTAGAQSPLDTWTWRNPLPPNEPVAGLAWGAGTFVAVGGDGSVLLSTNGTAWNGTGLWAPTLNGVAYGQNQFIAVGNDVINHGLVLTSSNGLSWATGYTNSAGVLWAVSATPTQV